MNDAELNPESADEEKLGPEHIEEKTKLTPEEIAELKRISRRRFIIAVVAGIVFLVLGYFAGQNVKNKNEPESSGVVSVSMWEGSASHTIEHIVGNL